MRQLIAVSTLCFVQFFTAQSTKNLGDFSAVKAYDKISVELVPSKDSKVEIISNNDQDVELVNKNGELKIRMIPTLLMQGADTKIKVYYTKLQEIQGSQGASISSNATVNGNRLQLTANEGSVIKLDLDVKNLSIKANSGGQIHLKGTVEKQDLIINSGAKYFGKELISQETEATANAGGHASIYAKESVIVKTRAGGVVDILGNPKDRNTKTVLGGKINFIK